MSRAYPQLDPDAPPVPAGYQPREGVIYGCGKAECPHCYELIPVTTQERPK